jgi:hypothetical protein
MKRKPKPKAKPRRVPRPRKPAPVPALPLETANLPAVRTADIVPVVDDKALTELVSKDFYDVALGKHKGLPLPVLALMDKLTPQQLLRWVPFCRTPAQYRWWRPGPGARCGSGVTCRTCPGETFDACRVRLEYVPGAFMLMCAQTLFPGRLSMRDMKVERDGDLFIASGYLVIKHHDGTTQETYGIGQCQVLKNVGHGRKGAITDWWKKTLNQTIGLCQDVYSGIGTQQDVPPETGDKPAPPTPDARTVWAALFGDVGKRLRTDARSVHKSGYTPRLKWEDAANLWPEFGESQAPFTTDDEAVECFAALPTESKKALYAKIRLKWLRSDKALMDAKYGHDAPDDFRPDDAKRTPEPKPGEPRRPKMGDVAAPQFKLWAQKTLGARSWRDAEPEVNRVVKLYAERQRRADLTDWLDLTPVDAQNLRALLQEEAAKGGKP